MSGLDRLPRRRSYLLRAWEEPGRSPERAAVWRFSLEDPHTGRCQGFATIEEVIATLRNDLTNEGTTSPAEQPPTMYTDDPDMLAENNPPAALGESRALPA